MLDIGLQELLLILVIALLVFGPKRLPELGRAIGRATREFRRASEEFRSTIETNLMAEESPPTPTSTVPDSPTPPLVAAETLPDSVLYPYGVHNESTSSESLSVTTQPTEPFVAQRASRLIHSRECTWAKRIPEADRVVFKHLGEATEQGLLLCPVCSPWEPEAS